MDHQIAKQILFRSTCRAPLDSKNCFRVRVNWLEPWKSLLEPWKPSLECRADGLEGQDSDFARMASEGTWWNLDNTGCNLENMAWKLEIASLAPQNNYDLYYIFCIYLNSIILINNRKLVFLKCNRRKYIIFSLHLFDHKRISCIFSYIAHLPKCIYWRTNQKYQPKLFSGQFSDICCTFF